MHFPMTTSFNLLSGWNVSCDHIQMAGRDLLRPECILAETDATLWTADARGGGMRIAPDGTQALIAQQPDHAHTPASRDEQQLVLGGTLPNRLAFDREGNIVIANFGTDGIELMTRDGAPLGKTNFVLTDSKGRIWLTVMMRQVPWTRSISEKTVDRYVGLVDEHGISRLSVAGDGALSAHEIYGPHDLGGFLDGVAFDAHGNLWITLILTNKLITLTLEGEVWTLLDDGNPEALARYEEHCQQGTPTPELMDACRGTVALMMASITFGDPDLRAVYIGGLYGTTLASFHSPAPGLALPDWSPR